MATLKSQIKKLPLDTVEDYAVAYLYGKGVKTTSYERFGDRNSITPGLRMNWLKKDGIPLDRYALDVAENINAEESLIIERTVEFIRRHPNATDVRKYVDKRTAQKTNPKMKSQKLTPADIQCLTDHAVKALGKETVRRETADYLDDPKGYFGELLDVPACRKDLFSLPVTDQITVIKAMQKRVGTITYKTMKKRTKSTKPKASRKQLSSQNKFKKMVNMAEKKIIDAAKSGKKIPSRRNALKAAAKQVYK